MSGAQGTREEAVTFACGGQILVGILHRPARPRRCGVVVVVGAPQYRVGSHRQFLLLARELSAAGFPVLRFDYRGMGDSEGDFLGFEAVEEDIRAAVGCLQDRVAGLKDVVLWGLCDGASAAAFYAASDPRIGGLIVLNPWVRSGQSVARARLRGYYLRRLASREFWAKILGGRLDVMGSIRGLADDIAANRGGASGDADIAASPVYSPARAGAADLPDRVAAALRRFAKPTLVVLCGADLTAQEFSLSVAKAKGMRAWSRRRNVALRSLPGATHTYPTGAQRAQVHAWCLEWLKRYTGEA